MMQTEVQVPCVVAARTLWRAPYAPALVRLAPNRQRLVWAARKDLVLDPQSADADELSATLKARLVREVEGAVVISLLTRGIRMELSLSKAVLTGTDGSA